jgi:N-acetylglucosaminyl-diphospho-decaprenol L-rhamnosyltransferase
MENDRVDVSIVIVNWNSTEYVRQCIASILSHTQGLTFEIIVIDSGSFDGCDRMLSQQYPGVLFLQSDTNLGFAKGNNRAFRKSSGDFILFINPDTEVVGPAISILHSALQSLPDAGAVGATLLNSDRSLQKSCIQSLPTITNQLLNSEMLRARWPRSRLWGMAPLYASDSHPREVEAISGACLMIKRSTFLKVGGFSEDYFMYAEDMDLAYKIGCIGCKNYYVPDATVVHHGGNSSRHAADMFSAVMMPEAIWRFLCKTRGRGYGLAYRAAMFGSALARVALLAMVSGLGRDGTRRSLHRMSLDKWVAILRWSLNRDRIVRQHYGSGGLLRPSRNMR